MKREDRTRKRILDALSKDRDGLTIVGIAALLGIHYTTASKYLAVMEAERKVMHRNIGMAKVFKLAESVGNERH